MCPVASSPGNSSESAESFTTIKSVKTRPSKSKPGHPLVDGTQSQTLHKSIHVGAVRENVFPWSSSTSVSSLRTGIWPYMFQPKYRPEKYKTIYEENIPAVYSQTDQGNRRSSVPVQTIKHVRQSKKDRHRLSELIAKTEPVSDTTEDSEIITPVRIPITLKPKPPETSKEHLLPKYISDFGPYAYTPLPNWLNRVLPNSTDRKTLLQAGKPWHPTDACTWAQDLKYLSTDPTTKYEQIHVKNSPKMEWGPSLCTVQHHQYVAEYKHKKEKSRSITSEDGIPELPIVVPIETLSTILQKESVPDVVITPTKNAMTPLAPVSEVVPIKELPPKQIVPVVSPVTPISPEIMAMLNKYNNLATLSYSKKYERKVAPIPKPKIEGIQAPWELLTEVCKWPTMAAKSKFFKSFVKPPPTREPVEIGKLEKTGNWPYALHMTKNPNPEGRDSLRRSTLGSAVDFSTIITGQLKRHKTSERNLRRDSKQGKSRSRGSEMSIKSAKTEGSASKKKPSTLDVIESGLIHDRKRDVGPPTGKKGAASFADGGEIFQMPPAITELIAEEVSTPSPIAEQLKFPGMETTLEVDIQTVNESQFTYKLSDLRFYEKNETHLAQKKKLTRVALYYATLCNTKQEVFSSSHVECYETGHLFITNSESSNIGQMFYPDGKLAVTCTKAELDLRPVRRYTVFDNQHNGGPVLAVFDTLGNGIVYDSRGKIRLNYSQNFGTFFEAGCGTPIRWRWHNIRLKPATLTRVSDSVENLLTIDDEVEEMRLRNINLYDTYREEWSVHAPVAGQPPPLFGSAGLKLQYTTKRGPAFKRGSVNWGKYTLIAPIKININKHFRLRLLDQKHVTLYYTAHNKNVKIELGVLLNPTLILKTVEVDSRRIMKNDISCEFDMIIGNTGSLLRILENVGDGNRVFPYLNPPTELLPLDHIETLLEYPKARPFVPSRFEEDYPEGKYQIIDSGTFQEVAPRPKRRGKTQFGHGMPGLGAVEEHHGRDHLTGIAQVAGHTEHNEENGEESESDDQEDELGMGGFNGTDNGDGKKFQEPNCLKNSMPILTEFEQMVDNERLWQIYLKERKMGGKTGNSNGTRTLQKKTSEIMIYMPA